MDFNISNKWVFSIGGVEIWITETIVNMWWIMLFLIVVAVITRIKLKNFKDVPKGFQNVLEMMVETFDNLVRGVAGEKFMFLGNWYFMVFSFVLLSNLSGLVFLRPPTADWSFTFTLALVTFVLIQSMAVKFRKGEYLKSLFEPYPVFFPLNVIGELARPVSLSFRLFGNILAGIILLSLLYENVILRFVLPIPLHGFFDVFAGILQTYVFCVLSLSFISAAAKAGSD